MKVQRRRSLLVSPKATPYRPASPRSNAGRIISSVSRKVEVQVGRRILRDFVRLLYSSNLES